jgi:hypothetical protein
MVDKQVTQSDVDARLTDQTGDVAGQFDGAPARRLDVNVFSINHNFIDFL